MAKYSSPSLIPQWYVDHYDDWEEIQTSEMDGMMTPDQLSRHGISKSHWKSPGSMTVCGNVVCNKAFVWPARAHNCHRCGNLFCKKCVNYKRRLNLLAKPDPDGRLYKVCGTCFDQGPQTFGQSYNLKNEFKRHKYLRDHTDSSKGQTNPNRRFNFEEECQRLVNGFKTTVGNSGLKKTLTEITSLITTPEWQKSRTKSYDTLAATCRGCSAEFSLTTQRHHCKICSTSVCTSCSSKDLIIYIAENGNVEEEMEQNGDQAGDHLPDPRLAVIKIIGCPEAEPDICLYLRVCATCKQRLIERQMKSVEQRMAEKSPSDECAWHDVIRINDQLRDIHNQIEEHLPKYQELIDALESPTTVTTHHSSNMQVLAKAQGELSDLFTRLHLTLMKAKQVKPVTKHQTKVFSNMIKARCSSYHTTMFLFRELKRKLELSTPPQVLLCILSIVHHNALNSCYLTIKQLILEVLHLTSRYHVDTNLLELLMAAEQVVEEDLRASVSKQNEDWSLHQQVIDDFLQLQLKQHRIIRLSKGRTRQLASTHVADVIFTRSRDALHQVWMQLNAKCVGSSLLSTKEAVKSLEAAVQELKVRQDADRKQEKADWVIVDH